MTRSDPIQQIKDLRRLLESYREGFPILKELVQNAEDALATCLDYGWLEGLAEAEHPLLKSPALFFINNGKFDERDARSLYYFQVSGKSDTQGTIGKFGLGLKSVFHLCEAFFYLAPNNLPKDSKPSCNIFNPWEGSHCHDDWDKFCLNDQRAIKKRLEHILAEIEHQEKWFIIWIPLRQVWQKTLKEKDENGTRLVAIKNEHNDFFGNSIADVLQKYPEFNQIDTIGSLLPNLHHLKKVRYWENNKNVSQVSLTDSIPRLQLKKLELYPDKKQTFQGEIAISKQDIAEKYTSNYLGNEVILRDRELEIILESLKEQENTAKIKPHCAVIISRMDNKLQQSYLTIRLATFLPVPIQESGRNKDEIKINSSSEYSYNITLHGYFFVNYSRTKITGWEPNQIGVRKTEENLAIKSREQLETEWNYILYNYLLTNLLESLSQFTSTYNLANTEIEAICQCLLHDSRLFNQENLKTIYKKHNYIYRLQRDAKKWDLVDACKRILYLPEIPNCDIFPGLSELSKRVYFTVKNKPNLYSANKPDKWNPQEICEVITSLTPTTIFQNKEHINYLKHFLQCYQLQISNLEIIDKLFVLLRIGLSINIQEDVRASVQSLISIITPSKIFTINCDNYIFQEICKLEDLSVLVIHQDFETEGIRYIKELDLNDATSILKCLISLFEQSTNDDKKQSNIYKLIQKIFKLNSLRNSLRDIIVQNLRIPITGKSLKNGREQFYTYPEIKTRSNFFTSDGKDELAKLFQKALINEEIIILDPQIAKTLNFDKSDLSLKLLTRETKLSEPQNRVELLQELLKNNVEKNKKQLRYLLHGCPDYFDSNETLYIIKDSNLLWEKVARQLFEKNGETWRIISSNLADIVTYFKVDELLNINALKLNNLIDEIKNDIQKNSESSIDGTLLEPEERDKILEEIGKNLKNEDIWRKLPLHTTLENECISIGKRVYLENRDFPRFNELKEFVKIIQFSDTLDKKWIPIWNPKIAIEIMLSQSKPAEYCQLILQSVSKLNLPDRAELEKYLRTRNWLINERDLLDISPNNILYISPSQLKSYTTKIVDLNQNKYPDTILPSYVREHLEYKWLIKLFDHWDAKKIIKFVLEQEKPDKYWGIILDAIKSLDYNLDLEIENLLKNREWIPVIDGRPKKPGNIIQLAEIEDLKPLQEYLPSIVELSQDAYASITLIIPEICEHEAYKWINSRFFKNNAWLQDNIISFMLSETKIDYGNQDTICQMILLTLQCWKRKDKEISDGNLNLLKQKAWLLNNAGDLFSPNQIIYFPPLSAEIKKILNLDKNSNYKIYEDFSNIEENATLLKWVENNLFISKRDDVLKKIGDILKSLSDYWIGDFTHINFPLSKFYEVFPNINSEDVPVWALAKQLTEDEFKEFILTAILKPISHRKLITIFNCISQHYPHPRESVVKVYNQYLKLAINKKYNFSREILPKIKFLNHANKWKDSHLISYEIPGISEEDIINDEQLEIIRDFLVQTEDKSHNQLTSSKDTSSEINTSNFQTIKEYFDLWQSYVQHELIGAFICVLMNLEDKGIRKLAFSYLRNRDSMETKKRLFENQNRKIPNFNITIRPAKVTLKSVPSLIGTYFDATLASTNKPRSLFDGSSLKTSDLELIHINPSDFTSYELSNLLKESVRRLLQNVYQIKPKSLDITWKDLEESDQISIENARDVILEDSVVYLLEQLGVDKINASISQLLDRYSQQRHSRNEKKRRNISTDEEDKGIQKTLKKLRQILEENNNSKIADDILKCVREYISRYGYHRQSIPLEIFQNADDAIVELKEMIPEDKLESERHQFVISYSENILYFMHWGRPINLFRHPKHPQASHRLKGFNQDLEKMLKFNSSDKRKGLTGKYGLGFKSVYLISDCPCVISANLGFRIIGGLLPTQLEASRIQQLQEQELKSHASLSDGTIIYLPVDPSLNIEVEKIIDKFKSYIYLLTIFSRAIKSIKLYANNSLIASWSWKVTTKVLGIKNFELGEIYPNIKAICFRSNESGSYNASILIGISVESITFLQQFPSIWVTTPTEEYLSLGFVINGKFDVTTGRDSLSKTSDKNSELAEVIGKELGRKLCDLFLNTQANWTKFQEIIGVKITEYEFWYRIWDNLAVSWLNKDKSYSLDIVRQILGGKHGMSHFITNCPSLPNGLWEDYQKLISYQKVSYILSGLLATKDCFAKVSQWAEFKRRCTDNIIHHSVWQNIIKLLDNPHNPRELKLVDVIKWELRDPLEANPEVAENLSKLLTENFIGLFQQEYPEIYKLLSRVKFQAENKKFYPSQNLLYKYYPHQDLLSNNYYHILGISSNSDQEYIKNSYRNLAKIYHPDVSKVEDAEEIFKKINSAYETLSDPGKREKYNQTIPSDRTSKTKKTEIHLLADFAPEDRLIHHEYTRESLNFFNICQGEIDISIEEIGRWAISAQTETQQQAVIEYLNKGNRSQELANYLKLNMTNSWLESNSHIQDLFTLEDLRKVIYNNISPPPTGQKPPTKPEVRPNPSKQSRKHPEIILENIYKWWEGENDRYISKYESKTYPQGVFPKISPDDDLKDQKLREQWMILYVSAATYPLGWSGPEKYSRFIAECQTSGWWKTFSSINPNENSQDWINLLEHYFNNKVDKMPYLHWLSRYPVIYLLDRYLEQYVNVFYSINSQHSEFDLRSFINTKTNPIFEGTINVPPLSKVLGIGANFIVRELVRKNIITNQLAYRHCFLAPRRVRDIFIEKLGCELENKAKLSNSITIYKFLTQHLGAEKVTFNRTFDLPFITIADKRELQARFFEQ